MVKSPLLVDDILARFDSPRPIGRGGQKVVFVINHPSEGRAVIKIGRYGSADTLERVKREVGVLAGLTSRFFPRQFEFQVVDTERYLIVEEFLNGEPLYDHYANFSNENEAVCLICELVTGFCELWSRRIVHRDIKPANIIITKDGPKIIDLGIARLLDFTSLTHSLAPFGPCTPDYASPEQLQNRKREIDHRSDQFSLGIVFAQLLLAGQHPFAPDCVGEGDSTPTNILSGHWAEDKVRRVASGNAFALICKMLAEQPYQRFRSYREFNDRLAELRGA